MKPFLATLDKLKASKVAEFVEKAKSESKASAKQPEKKATEKVAASLSTNQINHWIHIFFFAG